MILGNTANLCPELLKVLVNFAVRAHLRDKRCDLLLKGGFARTRRERLHYSFAGRVFNQKSLVRIHHSQNSVSLVGGHVIPTPNSTMLGTPQTISDAPLNPAKKSLIKAPINRNSFRPVLNRTQFSDQVCYSFIRYHCTPPS